MQIDPLPVFPPGYTQGLGTLNTAQAIGVVNTNFLPTGLFSLGNVIAPGLTEADLNAAGFNFRFEGTETPDRILNSFSSPQNIFFVQAVPEPGSLSLLTLAGLGVVARRRRS